LLALAGEFGFGVSSSLPITLCGNWEPYRPLCTVMSKLHADHRHKRAEGGLRMEEGRDRWPLGRAGLVQSAPLWDQTGWLSACGFVYN
jgi:hypothetical protein